MALDGGSSYSMMLPLQEGIYASAGGKGYGERITAKVCPEGAPNLELLFDDKLFLKPKEVLIRSELPTEASNPFAPSKAFVPTELGTKI